MTFVNLTHPRPSLHMACCIGSDSVQLLSLYKEGLALAKGAYIALAKGTYILKVTF